MKLFECSICAYKTSHGSAYKRHIAKIHNRKVFRISLTFFFSAVFQTSDSSDQNPDLDRHQNGKSDPDPDRH
jgi:hypothetical protein